MAPGVVDSEAGTEISAILYMSGSEFIKAGNSKRISYMFDIFQNLAT